MDIIATIGRIHVGNALDAQIEELLRQGINSLRFNLAKYDDLNELHERAIEIAKLKQKHSIRIMLDFPFPYKKPRLYLNNEAGVYTVKPEHLFKISINSSNTIFVDDSRVLELSIGETIYYSDGEGVWVVEEVHTDHIVVRAKNSCIIYTGKSISIGKLMKSQLLNTYREITEVVNPDSIALSFVMNSTDVLEFLGNKTPDFEIISKIETQNSVLNIDDIACHSNIMIGRGDLRLYADYNNLYQFQEQIAKSTRNLNKKLYFATGILQSLAKNVIPNPAEIIDVTKMLEYNPGGIILNTEVVIGRVDIAVSIINKILAQKQ
ncbi:pyruvate kinase [Paenibacillus sp. FSL K6-4396]|uniref:pyruvate kinase n=1 Tax=unclassified Paenibacillus TaxID=185978 RepID=UPI00177EFE7D|nr:pyruvate kinase [Paenibacillus sp. CFBP 13594]MBD8839090.1 hypothetical protein [Paenibacillus sp. CFBP 13594]